MTALKSIFITGAASGIGLETARLFAAKGWYLGLVDTNAASLSALEKELGPQNCFARVMDVTDPEDFSTVVTAFGEKTNGRMNVLFNNAGILRMGPNEEISLKEQHLTVDINIKGVLNGVNAALPLLKQTRGARIVSMCSTSSVYGLPELAVYSATKHAVGALTEAFDIELEQYGIKVCDIVAPYVATPMITKASRTAHSVPAAGVNLKPEQIAALVYKAVHGNKLHWKIHPFTYFLFFTFWALPFLKRPLIKRICLSKN